MTAPSPASRIFARLRPGTSGLVPCVVQDAATGQVRMVGYMNEAALARTLETGRVTFYSRSRSCLWTKGEQSGATLALVELRADCDGDVLLARARPAGPTCHLGRESCFGEVLWPEPRRDGGPPCEDASFLHAVESVIEARKSGRGITSPSGRSYVQTLLGGGRAAVAAKLTEEASELADAVAGEPDERVAEEAADLLFHLLVALAARDMGLAAVVAVLRRRFGTSGIDEKAARPRRG